MATGSTRLVPTAYPPLLDEPDFDPDLHLDLGEPEFVRGLDDLGYDAARAGQASGPVALTAPFRVLSDAGVAAAREVCALLEPDAIGGHDDRAPRYVPGATHRSRFLRGLASSPPLLDHASRLAGVRLVAHPLVDCRAYVNFAPRDLAKAVDTWHVDSIAYDIVVMLSDPAALRGGRLEWFEGTDEEAAALLGTRREALHLGGSADLPAERVGAASFAAAGHGLLQQGTHVVHRAARLEEPAERTTLVLGFAPADLHGADATNLDYVATWPHPGIAADIARHAAGRAAERLQALAATLDADASPEEAAAALRAAAIDVERAARALAPSPSPRTESGSPRTESGSPRTESGGRQLR